MKRDFTILPEWQSEQHRPNLRPYARRPYGAYAYEFPGARTCPFQNDKDEAAFWSRIETRQQRCPCFPTCNCSIKNPCPACLGKFAWCKEAANLHSHIRLPSPRKNGPEVISAMEKQTLMFQSDTSLLQYQMPSWMTIEQLKCTPNYEEYFDHQNTYAKILHPDDRNPDLRSAMLQKYPSQRCANQPLSEAEKKAATQLFPPMSVTPKFSMPYCNFVNAMWF